MVTTFDTMPCRNATASGPETVRTPRDSGSRKTGSANSGVTMRLARHSLPALDRAEGAALQGRGTAGFPGFDDASPASEGERPAWRRRAAVRAPDPRAAPRRDRAAYPDP